MIILRTSYLRHIKSKTLNTTTSRYLTLSKTHLNQNKTPNQFKTLNLKKTSTTPRVYPTHPSNSSSKFIDKISTNSNLQKLLQRLESQAVGSTQQQDLHQKQQDTEFDSFEDELRLRRDQALRTVYFRLNQKEINKEYLNDLIRVCQSIGCELNNVFLLGKCTRSIKEDFEWVLIEFNSTNCVKKVLDASRFFNKANIPLTIRILSFNNRETDQSKIPKLTISSSMPKIHHFRNIPTITSLPETGSFSDQIDYFYQSNCLTEIDYRTRYFIASLIDESLRNFFKDVVALPFGSSGNKFGSRSSDLDMSICLDGYYLKTSECVSSKHFHYIIKKGVNKIHLFEVLTALF